MVMFSRLHKYIYLGSNYKHTQPVTSNLGIKTTKKQCSVHHKLGVCSTGNPLIEFTAEIP